MADEIIAALIPIEDGADAEAKPLRQNFKYLDDRITAQATNISNKESISQKNTANGYCGLNANGSLPNDVLSKVTNSIVGAIYPVGSIYVTTDTSSTCPLASLITGSQWELKGSGKVLQGADSNHAPNTTIAAGLPNITAGVQHKDTDYDHGIAIRSAWGAFYASGWGTCVGRREGVSGSTQLNFDASRVNSIYGNSTTVQPPAYVVNIWRRTA